MLALKCTDREDFAQTPQRSCRFDFFATTPAACVVESDGACVEEDQGEGDGSESQGELVAVVSQEPVFPVHFPDVDS